MGYLDDLDDNIKRIEENIKHAELAQERGYDTVYDLAINNVRSIVKSTQFCVKCAKRKADKIGIPYHKFSCAGGCIRGGVFDNFKEINKNMWYIMHLTQRDNPQKEK